MTLKLNHMALTVSDRERSALFYGKYFGMTERVHDDSHLLLLRSQDGAILALSQGDRPSALPRTTHFGFEAPSAKAVIALRADFNANGVIEAEWQASGPTRVQVFDPDDYRVEAYSFS
jgi:catechol 2,3-dioxygenase-like lactoylglutathione lyase family enzyme